jgi:hypothetical protein
VKRFDGRTFVVCEPHAATREGLAREIERVGARCHAFAGLDDARTSLGADFGVHDGLILADEAVERMARAF